MYNQFYSFSENPFNLTPDPKFLYLSPSHREALASMIYGINERKGFISITGEVGTGKTTLIYSLLDNLSDKVKPIFIFHTTVTFEEFLANILIELNVPISNEDKTSLLHKLNEFLSKKMSQQETLAVIIDEAQNLPRESLEEFRMLSNIETSKQKLLQILLIGQPELEAKLNLGNLRQLKQRIAIRRHIRPLNLKESKEYINHRLNVVGSSSSKVFSSDATSLITNYAGGIPRTINILCDNALLIGYGLSQKKINGTIIKEVIENLQDHAKETSLSSNLAPPPSPKKALPFKGISFFLLSITTLLLVLFFLTDRGIFKDLKISQLINIKKESVSQRKDIPSTTLPTEQVLDRSIISTSAQPEVHKDPLKKKPAKKKIGTFEKIMTRTIVLKEGESLYSLALSNYHRADETIFDLILQANPTITDVREIHDNQEIILPVITPESYIKKAPDGTYQIHAGTFETLELATSCSTKVSDSGKQRSIKPHKFSSKDTWYRLTIGSFNNKEEALKTVNLLKEQDIIYIPPNKF